MYYDRLCNDDNNNNNNNRAGSLDTQIWSSVMQGRLDLKFDVKSYLFKFHLNDVHQAASLG